MGFGRCVDWVYASQASSVFLWRRSSRSVWSWEFDGGFMAVVRERLEGLVVVCTLNGFVVLNDVAK